MRLSYHKRIIIISGFLEAHLYNVFFLNRTREEEHFTTVLTDSQNFWRYKFEGTCMDSIIRSYTFGLMKFIIFVHKNAALYSI